MAGLPAVGTVMQAGGIAATDKHRFTGKTQDAATGLYYFNARYYDSEIGRFISSDPARDGLNWYVYANNNPGLYIDPTGLESVVNKRKKRANLNLNPNLNRSLKKS